MGLQLQRYEARNLLTKGVSSSEESWSLVQLVHSLASSALDLSVLKLPLIYLGNGFAVIGVTVSLSLRKLELFVQHAVNILRLK